MNRTVKIVIIITVILVAAVVILGLNFFKDKNSEKPISNLTVNTAEDLTSLVDKIYEGVTIEMPMLQTMQLDIVDVDQLNSFTGLSSSEGIEYVVVSEPMMTSQAYSLVLVKVKGGVNANDIAKAMNENINARKWLCVAAEKVYTAASGDVVCLVMSNKDTAKAVYDSFKIQAGSVSQEYERTVEEPELPEDMY